MVKNIGTKIMLVSILSLSIVVFVFATGTPFVSAETADEIYYVDEVTGDFANIKPLSNASTTYPAGSSIELVDSVSVPNGFPIYYNTDTNLTNTCAGVAGSMIVGYYDRYHEGLIPGASAFSSQFNRYLPMGMLSGAVQNVINSLYTMMGTNTESPGTSETQFFDGIEEYCESKGLTFAKDSVANNNNFNISLLKQKLSAGKPVVLFSSVHNTISINMANQSISVTSSSVPHIYVVWGYNCYKVYSANDVLIDTIETLSVSNGNSAAMKMVYINSEFLTIENAYACDIN